MQAFSAIINNGCLNGTPHLMNRIIDDNGNTIKMYKSKVHRQIISNETSNKMKEILTAVVDGVDKNNPTSASISGYKIAGKSGTAQNLNAKRKLKLDENDRERYVPSYIGCIMLNSEDPLIIMVQIDSPTYPPTEYYGGRVAAPLFREIALKILNYYNIPPDRTDEYRLEMFRITPKCEGLSLSAARDKLFANDFNNFEFSGNGNTVLQQIPPCGTTINKNTKIQLYTEEISDDDKITVPDVTGLTQVQANNLLANHKLNIQISNNSKKIGYAISQDPEPGTTVLKGHIVDVVFVLKDETD